MAPQSGNQGGLWVSAQKTRHTTQTEAGQTDAGRVQKEKQDPPSQSSFVVAEQQSDHRWPEAKGPIPILECSPREPWGGCKERSSSPGVRKSSTGDARKPERTRPPLAVPASTSRPGRNPLALDLALCGRPASALRGRAVPHPAGLHLGFSLAGIWSLPRTP